MKINRRLKTKTKQRQMKLKNEACGTHIFYLPVRPSVCLSVGLWLESKNRKQKQKQKVQKKQRLSFFQGSQNAKSTTITNSESVECFQRGTQARGRLLCMCVCVCNSCADSQAHWQRGAKWKNWPTLAERERKINDVVYDKA